MSEGTDGTTTRTQAGTLKDDLDDLVLHLERMARNLKGRFQTFVEGEDFARFDGALDAVRREVAAHLRPKDGRVVYLDPRITAEAVSAIVNGAGEHDRFFLRLEGDRGLEHRWTDVDGEEYAQVLDVEVFEVTPMVWQRVTRIREAVAR